MTLRSLAAAVLLPVVVGCNVGDVGPIDDNAGADAAPSTGGDLGPAALTSILAGSFAPLPGYVDVVGRAQLVSPVGGGNDLSIAVAGLLPNTAYTAHVHALPCAQQGGGHYKIDPTVVDTVEANELWIRMTTDPDGVGRAEVSSLHGPRGDAMSVVVHDPVDATKMACADLLPSEPAQVVAAGTLSPLPGVEPQDQTIGGSVSLRRTVGGTIVTMTVTGLTEGVEYGAHVHALPCGVNAAGGHYKIDPTVVDTLEANELWPALTIGAGGDATGLVSSPHVSRADAQSVVVHRPIAPGQAPKVACADLVRSYPPLVTTGGAVTLPDAAALGYASLNGTATMVRDLGGETTVRVDIAGLQPTVEYAMHVHDQPCAYKSGGGHYKIDPAVSDVLEGNEMWIGVVGDGAGLATSEIEFATTARADAQSLVLHDPAAGARLACFDLR
jgi:hypothetical protein